MPARGGRVIFGVNHLAIEARDTDPEPGSQRKTVGVQASLQIVEIPEEAENIQFREKDLPDKYQGALQDVR